MAQGGHELVPIDQDEEAQPEESEQVEETCQEEGEDMMAWSLEVEAPRRCQVPKADPRHKKMKQIARTGFNHFDEDSIPGCLNQECEADIMRIESSSVGQGQYDIAEACVDSDASETVGAKTAYSRTSH